MAYDREVIELRYDSVDREVAKLFGRIDEHNTWSRDYIEPPGVHCVDSQIRQPALYLVTDDPRGYRRTRW